ncbi:MAG: FecR domain-containing protein [Lentisphaerae bacterium]|nr:FecR domain-containing protein [Lentisphaerota bacterium]
MHRHSGLYLALVAVLCITATLAVAVPYEPVFRLVQANGDVTVKTPGSSGFDDAQEGKAYGYGSSLHTEKRGSVVIMLADNNSCQVGPMASLDVVEGSMDPSQKSILLQSGKIEASLEEQNELSVVTPCSSAHGVGGAFTAEVKSEADLKIAVFGCASGAVSIMSDMFQIPLLDADDLVSVSCAEDQSFIRIKNIKGSFDVVFIDDTGTPRTVTLEQNGVVKIWRRKADTSDAMVVTVLIVGPDGSLTEAVNYTIEPEADGAPVEPPVMADDDDDDGTTTTTIEETDYLWPDDDDDDDPGTDSSTTTTTSTMPSFTPVGNR